MVFCICATDALDAALVRRFPTNHSLVMPKTGWCGGTTRSTTKCLTGNQRGLHGSTERMPNS